MTFVPFNFKVWITQAGAFTGRHFFLCRCSQGKLQGGGGFSQYSPIFTLFPITFWFSFPTIHLQPPISNWAFQWPTGPFAILCLCTHMSSLLPCILFFPSYHRITKSFLNSGSFATKLNQNSWPFFPQHVPSTSLLWLTSFLAFTSQPKTAPCLFFLDF